MVTAHRAQPGVVDAPDFFPYERFVVAPGRWSEAAQYQRSVDRKLLTARIATWTLGTLTGLAFTVWFFVGTVLNAEAKDMIFGTYAAAGILIMALALTTGLDFAVRTVIDDRVGRDVRSRDDLFRDASGLSQFSQTVDLTDQQLWDVAFDIINLENARKAADWQRKSIPTGNLTRAARNDRHASDRALRRSAAAIAETLDPTPPFTSSDKGGN